MRGACIRPRTPAPPGLGHRAAHRATSGLRPLGRDPVDRLRAGRDRLACDRPTAGRARPRPRQQRDVPVGHRRRTRPRRRRGGAASTVLAYLYPDEGGIATLSDRLADVISPAFARGRQVGQVLIAARSPTTPTPCGREASPRDPAEHKRIATYWADGAGTVTPPGHWNRIALDLVGAAGWYTFRASLLFSTPNSAQADRPEAELAGDVIARKRRTVKPCRGGPPGRPPRGRLVHESAPAAMSETTAAPGLRSASPVPIGRGRCCRRPRTRASERGGVRAVLA